MDHHCYFTNNCIGYNTLKAFWLFLFYSGLMSFFGVTTICTKFIEKQLASDGQYSALDLVKTLMALLNPAFGSWAGLFDLFVL